MTTTCFGLSYLENPFAYFANFPLLLFVSVLFCFPPVISVCMHFSFSECPECPRCLIQIFSTNPYIVTSEAKQRRPSPLCVHEHVNAVCLRKVADQLSKAFGFL